MHVFGCWGEARPRENPLYIRRSCRLLLRKAEAGALTLVHPECTFIILTNADGDCFCFVCTLIKDMVLENMLSVWHRVRCLEGYSMSLSLLTLIHENTEFLPGLHWTLPGFADWCLKGIKTIGDLSMRVPCSCFRKSKSNMVSLITIFIQMLTNQELHFV